MERRNFSMDEVVSYCNQYGFIFQGSEIYGGLANTWDYGPLGARLKNLVKDAWRYYFIHFFGRKIFDIIWLLPINELYTSRRG